MVAAAPLYERRTDKARGRHLVATTRIEKGRLVLCERPLLFQQNLANVRDAWVCHNCGAFVGDADAALRHRFRDGSGGGSGGGGESSDGNHLRDGNAEVGPDPSSLLLVSSPVVVNCRHKCGHAYCSPACERDAYEAHHRWLCTGLVEYVGHPLVQFKAYAAETNEVLLAAATWWVVQHRGAPRHAAPSSRDDDDHHHHHHHDPKNDSRDSTTIGGPYTDFVMEPWWDVSVLDLLHGKDPGGFVEAIRVQRAQREICEQAAALFNQALAVASHPQGDDAGDGSIADAAAVVIPPMSALDIAQRLGSFSQNAIGFRRRHPLCREVFDPDFRRRRHREIVKALEEAGFLGDCQEEEEEEEDDDDDGGGGDDEAMTSMGSSNVDGHDAMDTGLDDDEDVNEPITPEDVATLLSGLFIDEDGTVLEANQAAKPSKDEHGTVDKEGQRVRDTTGDDLDYVFPPLDGTALYSTTCKMNHSCDPNVIVLFKRTSFGRLHPLVAHCVALRDIAEGEELTISYIENDRPYDERQLALASYGFTCQCVKCKRDESSNDQVMEATASPEQDLFGSEDDEDDDDDGGRANAMPNSARDEFLDNAADESGEIALEQLLERLDSRSNCSQFGSVPLAMAARVFGFIVQLGASLLERAEIKENPHSPVVSNVLSTYLTGARERDYCLCRISGIDLEHHLYNELRLRGRFSHVTHREAYWCSVLAAALGYAHEGSFLEALAFLDKGIVLGLQRDDHSLRFFVDYVEFHAGQMAIGPLPPSLNAVIPHYQSTGHRQRAEDLGLACALVNSISECRTPVSFDEFRSEFLEPNKPVVVRDYASNWKALDSMRNLGQLVYHHGHRLVPIEIGSIVPGTTGDKASAMKEELMTLRTFVESFLVASTDHGVWSLADAIDRSGVAYMAQHALLTQIPDLARGVALHPDLCGPSGPDRVNAWVGTGGTRTPLHFDSYDNLLVQLVGVKYVRLYTADAADKLPRFLINGESVSYGMQGNMSSLNCELEGTDDATFTDTLLFPGDCLFIPSRVWHYVRSLSTSVSVNYWFNAA